MLELCLGDLCEWYKSVAFFVRGLIKKNRECFGHFAWVDPSSVCSSVWNTKQSSMHNGALLKTFIESNRSKKYILILYHMQDAKHWVLMVLDMKQQLVIIYDPLLCESRDEYAPLLTILRRCLGIKDVRKHMCFGKAAQQPTGSVLSGYYVCRFMYDIILGYGHMVDLKGKYMRTRGFTKKELEVVLDLFAGIAFSIIWVCW